MKKSKWLVIGGAHGSYTFDLFGAVCRHGVSVRFVKTVPRSEGSFAHERFDDERFLSIDWRRRPLREVAKFIAEVPPDVVFFLGVEARAAEAVALATLPRSVPVLYASDANGMTALAKPDGFLLRRVVYRHVFRRVDLALSLGLTNELAHSLLGMRSHAYLPMLTVDFEAMALGEGSTECARGDVKTLLVVSRLIERKNLSAVIEAIGGDAVLRKTLRLRVAGEGPCREPWQLLGERLGVNIEWLGAVPRSDVGALYRDADAMILPSRDEPWGLVVCEALGLGVPVLATPEVGAAVSLAGLTQAVLLSRGCGTEQIRDQLEAYVERADVLARAAASSAAEIRESFGNESVARRLIELVQTVVAR